MRACPIALAPLGRRSVYDPVAVTSIPLAVRATESTATRCPFDRTSHRSTRMAQSIASDLTVTAVVDRCDQDGEAHGVGAEVRGVASERRV